MAAFQLDPNQACSQSDTRAACERLVADFNRIVADQCRESQFSSLGVCRGTAPSSYSALPRSTQTRLVAYPRGTTVFGDSAEAITDTLLAGQSGAQTSAPPPAPPAGDTGTATPPTGPTQGAMTIGEATTACADQPVRERPGCIAGLMGMMPPPPVDRPVEDTGAGSIGAIVPPEPGTGTTPPPTPQQAEQRCNGGEQQRSESLEDCIKRLTGGGGGGGPNTFSIFANFIGEFLSQRSSSSAPLEGISGTGGTEFTWAGGLDLGFIYWISEYFGVGAHFEMRMLDSYDGGEVAAGNVGLYGAGINFTARYPVADWLHIFLRGSLTVGGASTHGEKITGGGEEGGFDLDGDVFVSSAAVVGAEAYIAKWFSVFAAVGGDFMLYHEKELPSFMIDQRIYGIFGDTATLRFDAGAAFHF